MLDPRDFFAQHPQGSRYAIPWTHWYVSGGKDGQEPPENQKKRMKLFDEARATADLEKRGEIMKQIFDLAAEDFETIGVCLAVNDLRHRQEQPARTCRRSMPNCLVVAESRPGPAAAVLLQRPDRQRRRGRRTAGLPCSAGGLDRRSARRRSGSNASAFIVKRLLWMIPSLFVGSFLAFVLIQLPPGDYVTTYIATLAASNEVVDQNTAADLRERFGLDQPMIVQYWKWITGILLRGDFGLVFEWQQPVSDLIWERMALTLVLTFATLLATWAIALPIGVFSAVQQIFDRRLRRHLHQLPRPRHPELPARAGADVRRRGRIRAGGRRAVLRAVPERALELGKTLDLLAHLWIPVIILAVSGTASLIRVMRANMLDELNKPYVTTARAKGLSEFRLLVKYPVRLALNPFISTIAWLLPNLVSGSIIVAIVLSLPTAGAAAAAVADGQDMYLAGAFILLICALTLVGSLISDILLALVDPRIRLRVGAP